MRKLGGWTRLGIVLSVVWFIGSFGYWWMQYVDNKTSGAWILYEACVKEQKKTSDVCFNDRLAYRTAPTGSEATEIAMVSVLPIPFAWLLVSLVYLIVRWVRRGFAS